MDSSAFPSPILAPRGGRPWRLLLVEDDFETQGAVANLLRDEGYEVDCAANGAEALSVLAGKAELPALIILDILDFEGRRRSVTLGRLNRAAREA